MTLRLTRIAIAAAFLGLVFPTIVLAHAKLIRSDPAARATLARAPERIRLWFNESLEAAYSKAELRDAADRVVPAVTSQVDSANRKLLELTLPALAPGQYNVHYRVLSVDGHIVQSQLRFTVRRAAQ